MRLSVLIPVYNEESTIAEVIDRVDAVDMPDIQKEIIVVDDGSTDRTAEILETKRSVLKHVHASRVNLGKGTAIRIGLTYVDGDVVIIQDADLELDPSEYAQLLAPIVRGESNVVYGSRFARRMGSAIPLRTEVANRVLTWLTNVLYGTRLSDMATAYKVIRTPVIFSLRLDCRGFEFEPEVTAKLARLGEKIVEVPISYRPRTALEGKKIRWQHGLGYVYCLLKYRLIHRRRLLRQEANAARAPAARW